MIINKTANSLFHCVSTLGLAIVTTSESAWLSNCFPLTAAAVLRALDAAVNTAGGIAGNPDFHRRLKISVSWTFLALHHAFGTAALIFLSAQAKDVALTKFAPKVLRRAICTKRGFLPYTSGRRRTLQ